MVDVTQPEPWSRTARGYAESAAAHFEPFALDALRLAGVRAEDRVLDVAAGPGTLAIPAAATASVTAVDFSVEMVAAVGARAAERGVRLDALVADGQDLPFEDESFDAAFSMFGLFMFPDREAGFRELARVLKPRGRAVVATWQPRDPDHPFSLADRLLRPEEVPSFDEESAPTPSMPLSDPSELSAEMGAAGFEVTVERCVHTLRFDSAAAVARDMLRSHVGFVMLEATVGADAFRKVATSLHSVLHEALGDGPVEVPLAAWLGYGVKPG